MSSTDREAQVVAMLDELDRLDATTNPKENHMSSTPRTASTTDAKKRQAEKDGPVDFGPMAARGDDPGVDSCSVTDTDQPPVLPDTSGGVQMSPEEVDALPVGTVLLWPHNGLAWQRDDCALDKSRPWCSASDLAGSYPSTHVAEQPVSVLWTPPPAPREPWRAISTDRDKPTLAKVTAGFGDHGWSIVGEWWRTEDAFYAAPNDYMADLDHVTAVELLDTYDPVTQVPVERALIDEWLRDEPMIVSGIRRDMQITPGGRGGEIRHTPATPGHRACGCPADALVNWADRLAALVADERGANSSDQHAPGSSAVDGAES